MSAAGAEARRSRKVERNGVSRSSKKKSTGAGCEGVTDVVPPSVVVVKVYAVEERALSRNRRWESAKESRGRRRGPV